LRSPFPLAPSLRSLGFPQTGCVSSQVHTIFPLGCLPVPPMIFLLPLPSKVLAVVAVLSPSPGFRHSFVFTFPSQPDCRPRSFFCSLGFPDVPLEATQSRGAPFVLSLYQPSWVVTSPPWEIGSYPDALQGALPSKFVSPRYTYPPSLAATLGQLYFPRVPLWVARFSPRLLLFLLYRKNFLSRAVNGLLAF